MQDRLLVPPDLDGRQHQDGREQRQQDSVRHQPRSPAQRLRCPCPTPSWWLPRGSFFASGCYAIASQAHDGNSLTGKLAAPVSGKVTAVLQLTVGGKPATVRFAVG